jgi:hypothetical protein
MRMRKILRPKDLIGPGRPFGSLMTLWRLRQEPDFPMPIEIGGGIGFFEDELNSYLESRPRRRRVAPVLRAEA